MGVAFEQAGNARFAIGGADRSRSENAGQQRAEHPTDAMHAKHVERVVVTQLALEPGRGPETDEAGDRADQRALPGQDIARRRGSGSEGRRPRRKSGRAPRDVRDAPTRCQPRPEPLRRPRNGSRRWRRQRASQPLAPSRRLKPNQPTQSRPRPTKAMDGCKRPEVFLPIAGARADHQRRHQGPRRRR